MKQADSDTGLYRSITLVACNNYKLLKAHLDKIMHDIDRRQANFND